MQRFGVALIVVAIGSGLVLQFSKQLLDGASSLERVAVILAAVATPMVVIAGAYLLYRGKQLAARGRAAAGSNDTRPPVVYLRPFGEDESMAGQVFSALLTAKVYGGLASREEQLAEAVAPLGPLVTIGQPVETLPKPGASRAYADDLEWRRVVDDWLARARLVVLRPGSTEGVRWETERAFATVTSDRLVLLFIAAKRRVYDAISESLRTGAGITLPQFDEVRSRRRASGFVTFSSDWKPEFLRLKVPFWRSSQYKWMRKSFHYALGPVFQRLHVEWHSLPISALRVVSVGCLGLIALLSVTVLILFVAGAVTGNRSNVRYANPLPATNLVVPAAPIRSRGGCRRAGAGRHPRFRTSARGPP